MYIFRFEGFSHVFRRENVETVRDTVCNLKIINCVRGNYRFSRSEFSKVNKVLNYKFKGCILFPRDVYIYILGKLTIHPSNL